MRLSKIVTMCDTSHRLRFVLLERSLRAVGCDLPIWLIPYGPDQFDLPKNSSWWLDENLSQWINQTGINNRKRKYQCLTTDNYQFVDSDVFFLQNPESILEPHSGFVVCCNEWTMANDAYSRVTTDDSKRILQENSTMWEKNVFCAGQFACDEKLYDTKMLIAVAESNTMRSTCMHPDLGDQEGLNLLVSQSKVKVTNLTLPPYQMESSWSGDYRNETSSYWSNPERKPYLIHYYSETAQMHEDRAIFETFRNLLTETEQQEWLTEAKHWHLKRAEWDQQRMATLRERTPILRKISNRLKRSARMLLTGK